MLGETGEGIFVPRLVALILSAMLLSAGTAQSQSGRGDPWRDITPRAGLAGWHMAGGDAVFSAANGELIGSAAPGPNNSWLVSNEDFGDFILEFEARTDLALNSGVMIRGQSRPEYRDGVVFGYQAEIDPSSRRWSGGIYDEQRRAWLYTLGRNEAARRAFRPGQWNRYRVEAIGDRLRTFVNGVPAADIVDEADARGFIAFQVHAISDEQAAKGASVRFRRVRVITDQPARFALPETQLEQQGWLANRLTDGEKRAGWALLWDGRSGAGWRGVRNADFPKRGWTIEGGVLSVHGGGGDIVTLRPYRDFELSIDFRLTPGANSGIKYLLDPERLRSGQVEGLEYQLLDDDRHPDAKMGRDGNRTAASLYDLIAARNLSDPDNPAKRINPPGEWNRATIVVRGAHVEHWLNGHKVVDFDRRSPALGALVARSKFAGRKGFGGAEQGAILLQDHGDRVDFRSIKLRELKGAL